MWHEQISKIMKKEQDEKSKSLTVNISEKWNNGKTFTIIVRNYDRPWKHEL